MPPPPTPPPHHRQIRSYVLREGRLTPAQRRALQQLMPTYGIQLPPPGATPPALQQHFPHPAPTHLEIGFGNGAALLAMAEQTPDHNFLGAEVHRPGIGHLLLQLHARNITNIKIFHADAIQVLTHAIPSQTLTAIHLYFPDPWPKKKHHKRRLLQPNFITLATNALTPGGHLHFATDWQDYAEQTLTQLQQSPNLTNPAGNNHYTPHPKTRPPTKFEQRGKKLGHAVWDIVMRKVK